MGEHPPNGYREGLLSSSNKQCVCLRVELTRGGDENPLNSAVLDETSQPAPGRLSNVVTGERTWAGTSCGRCATGWRPRSPTSAASTPTPPRSWADRQGDRHRGARRRLGGAADRQPRRAGPRLPPGPRREKVEAGLRKAQGLRWGWAKRQREIAEQQRQLQAITEDQGRPRANPREVPRSSPLHKRYLDQDVLAGGQLPSRPRSLSWTRR
jgi:hypothetical protein